MLLKECGNLKDSKVYTHETELRIAKTLLAEDNLTESLIHY